MRAEFVDWKTKTKNLHELKSSVELWETAEGEDLCGFVTMSELHCISKSQTLSK